MVREKNPLGAFFRDNFFFGNDFFFSQGRGKKKNGEHVSVENPEVKKAVLLSPGLDYRGVKTELLAKNLQKDQSLVFAASKADGNNAEENKKLYALALSLNKHLILFGGAGHGTELFDLKKEFDLTGALLKFLENGAIN